jgi:hypothetical protein
MNLITETIFIMALPQNATPVKLSSLALHKNRNISINAIPNII